MDDNISSDASEKFDVIDPELGYGVIYQAASWYVPKGTWDILEDLDLFYLTSLSKIGDFALMDLESDPFETISTVTTKSYSDNQKKVIGALLKMKDAGVKDILVWLDD